MDISRKTVILLFTILLVLAGTLGWYYYEKSLWQTTDNQHIYLIKKQGKRIFVKVNTELDMCEICDCKILNGMWPVSSLREAVDLFGEPDNYTEEKNGNQILEYWYYGGRVIFLRENIYDGPVYILIAYPTNYSYMDFFCKEISNRIDPDREETIVVITDKKYDDLISVIIIKGKRVDEFITE